MTQTQKRPVVAVLFGGTSGEHSISCATAAGLIPNIDTGRYRVVPIGISRDGQWVAYGAGELGGLAGGEAQVETAGRARVVLASGGPDGGCTLLGLDDDAAASDVDVVFPLLHGPFGEDGTVQGLAEMMGVRYVGAGVLASAACMDKHYTKVVLAGQGLGVAPYGVVRPGQAIDSALLERIEALGMPVYVKPARAGSSLGITRVTSREGIAAAIEAARIHDPKVIVESNVEGREIEIGVLGAAPAVAGQTLANTRTEAFGVEVRTTVPGEVVFEKDLSDFYDWQTKYFARGEVGMAIPANLSEDVTRRARELAAAAFVALGCEGLSRVDIFYTSTGDLIVNEINTLPGFTPHSMFPVLWQHMGMDFTQLCTDLIEQALARPVGLR